MTIENIIKNALKEDIPTEDITSAALFADQESEAYFIAKEKGVVSGIGIAERVFKTVDPALHFKAIQGEGAIVEDGDMVAIVKGNTKSILMAERTALNILQRMSGISTLTKAYVDATRHTDVKILDTRKTMPNMRVLDKLAVRYGGGYNHRMSLSDQAMLKDNHLNAVDSLSEAVAIVRQHVGPKTLVEVEVETLDQLDEALNTSCDVIMLDNMSLDETHEAVRRTRHKKKLEASGNITLKNVKEVAQTGVDFISVGALTHSAKAFDISLKFR